MCKVGPMPSKSIHSHMEMHKINKTLAQYMNCKLVYILALTYLLEQNQSIPFRRSTCTHVSLNDKSNLYLQGLGLGLSWNRDD